MFYWYQHLCDKTDKTTTKILIFTYSLQGRVENGKKCFCWSYNRDYHSLLMMLTLFLDSVNSVSHRLLGSLVREMSRLRPSEVSWSWELSVCFLTPTGSGVLRLAGAGMEFLMRLTPTLETLELSLAMFIIWEDILLMGAILTMIFVVFWYQWWWCVDTEARLSEAESPGSEAL